MNLSVMREMTQAAQQAQTQEAAKPATASTPPESKFRMDDAQACPTDVNCSAVQQSQASQDPAHVRDATTPERILAGKVDQMVQRLRELQRVTAPPDVSMQKTLEDAAAKMDDPRKVDSAINDMVAECEKQAALGGNPDAALMARLMKLQRVVQNVGMKLELSTKIVEHGTSGMKTVLQTQA